MIERRGFRSVLIGLAALAYGGAGATEPPDLLNYQGVLRDAAGAPLAGSFDMVFRFFDDPVTGTEILADQHVGAGAVTVAGGLFSAELGGGTVVPFTASSLAELFGEYSTVYMQIDVEGEALAPRIRVLSSGFSLNSDSLDGRDAIEFLDISSNQTKTGDLTLDGTTGGGDLVVTNGGSILLDGVGGFLGSSSCDLRVQNGCKLEVSGVGSNLEVSGGSDLKVRGDGLGKGGLKVENGASLEVSGGGDVLMGLGADLMTAGGDVVLDGSDVRVTAKMGKGSLKVQDGANLEITGGGDVVLDGSDVRVTAKMGKGSLKVQDGANLEITGGGDVTMGTGSDLHVMSGANLMLEGGGDLTVSGSGSDLHVSGGSNLTVSGTGNLSVGTGSGVRVSGPGGLIVDGQGASSGDLTLQGGSDLWLVGDGAQALNLQQASLHLFSSETNPTPDLSLVPSGALGTDMVVNAGLNVVGPGSVEVSTDISIEPDSDLSIRGPQARFVLANHDLDEKLVLRFEAENRMELWADLLVESPSGLLHDILIGVAPGPEIDLRVGRGSLCLDSDGACAQMENQNGRVRALAYDTGSSDLAEMYPSAEALEPGDVVVLDAAAAGQVRKARATDDEGILSVISTTPAVVLGVPTDEEIAALEAEGALATDFGGLVRSPDSYPVTLAGRVPVKVSDEGGVVRPGDFLTNSSTPGVAMKASRRGLVLGQALQSWAGPGQGTIVAWVVPGASNPFAHAPASAAGDGGEAGHASGGHAAGLEADLPDPRATYQTGAPLVEARLDAEGHLHARSFQSDSAGLAASVTVSEAVEPGDVLVADPDAPGMMRRASASADPAVVGIVAGKPGLLLGTDYVRAPDPVGDGGTTAAAETDIATEIRHPTTAALALAGIVPCKVDAGFGPIRAGDLLTTSPTPGHAMRAESFVPGTVVAKALESLDAGTGVVRVLVMPR